MDSRCCCRSRIWFISLLFRSVSFRISSSFWFLSSATQWLFAKNTTFCWCDIKYKIHRLPSTFRLFVWEDSIILKSTINITKRPFVMKSVFLADIQPCNLPRRRSYSWFRSIKHDDTRMQSTSLSIFKARSCSKRQRRVFLLSWGHLLGRQ